MIGVINGEVVIVAPPGERIRFRSVEESERFQDLYAFAVDTQRRGARLGLVRHNGSSKRKGKRRGPRS